MYFNIIQSLRQHVISSLMRGYLAKLKNGETLTIGSVDINREGVHMRYRRWLIKRKVFVPWPDVYKYLDRGRLHLYSGNDKKIRVSLNLLTLWNAVVLSALLNYLWKDGRLYSELGI